MGFKESGGCFFVFVDVFEADEGGVLFCLNLFGAYGHLNALSLAGPG